MNIFIPFLSSLKNFPLIHDLKNLIDHTLQKREKQKCDMILFLITGGVFSLLQSLVVGE